MKKHLVFFVLILQASFSALASDFVNCDIAEVVVSGDQNGHVGLICPLPIVGAPACATAGGFVGFDKSTTEGKHFLALFSMALAMNLKVEGMVNRSICSPYQNNVALLTSLRVRH